MAWTPQPNAKPSDILDSAVDDMQAARYEEALQKFVWFHDASRTERGMGGVRLSFALGYWINLASQYPPAMTAFVNLREELELRCRDSHGEFQTFHDVSALNRCLGEERRTIDLFMEIAKDYPNNAKRLYHVAERILVAHGMYLQCAPFLDWEQRIETSISAYKIGLNYEESWMDCEPTPFKFARRHFETESATLVALLSLNGRRKEAELVRERCVAVLDDAADHASQLESIVFVGLAFDIAPFSSVFVGRTDECLQASVTARSWIQPEGPQASMTTRSILCFLKTVVS